jgi:hypothetical protein
MNRYASHAKLSSLVPFLFVPRQFGLQYRQGLDFLTSSFQKEHPVVQSN